MQTEKNCYRLRKEHGGSLGARNELGMSVNTPDGLRLLCASLAYKARQHTESKPKDSTRQRNLAQ